MRNKTHLAIGVLFMIIFLQNVFNIGIFVSVFIISTLLPNLDQFGSSKRAGNMMVWKPIKHVLKPRGFLHSFTFCLIITFVFTWYLPIFAFPFFLGYSIHLLADAWTVEGIKPFWPLNNIAKGRVQTGGSLEETIFFIFVILDIVFVFIYLV